ncbi:dynein light chain LC8-type [Fusarium odoratissimum NRRL 54006]|uniref:Dynein light chain LC8-type n=1 Tax=Fusarium odoratissimum (strain NRRL 54006) TaxID=1089451 RepID=X0KEB6_FUSO5|nr:dynein light chain LC8-type [Fusarium odoratissimum NRRL 54006]XP_031074012.1 dynein light chain LC8-type [Fusarium odoratissimum NRRL 54006]XP_031074013.1 dynein light chain LC8-type [Fusarium odoratissimum NRRL 54006]XP_031074014.1 dynein light chain LC8-type [Fusarium odoratissimum NRRL 54006]EXM11922.1 dynein light chain LC8-type [Fusarium odoratissimum NRRL 54006]EXM11923.1 dynein light chain LC8-type [Fusarium odoratissimum NRRL 54006]EXM11924.1 dynein light chain LC8-type [Fusarium 
MADAHVPKAESPVAREKLEAQIKSADMTEDMQQESIEVAQEAMAKFTIEKDIAQHIKRTVRTHQASHDRSHTYRM